MMYIVKKGDKVHHVNGSERVAKLVGRSKGCIDYWFSRKAKVKVVIDGFEITREDENIG